MSGQLGLFAFGVDEGGEQTERPGPPPKSRRAPAKKLEAFGVDDVVEQTERPSPPIRLPVVQAPQAFQRPLFDAKDLGNGYPYASPDLHCRDFWNPRGVSVCPIISCRWHLLELRNGDQRGNFTERVSDRVAAMRIHCVWDAVAEVKRRFLGEDTPLDNIAEYLEVEKSRAQEMLDASLSKPAVRMAMKFGCDIKRTKRRVRGESGSEDEWKEEWG